ncbi:hypothetical protein [Spirulina sp. 06S082]|nr:hypothetical protein [Spirulina sp. 06S082]MEA5468922.1 hypothetical protein [Spirulina sp. 06S082]
MKQYLDFLAILCCELVFVWREAIASGQPKIEAIMQSAIEQ